jgi:hypothetical protein
MTGTVRTTLPELTLAIVDNATGARMLSRLREMGSR